ncbi:tetratricopeptide repeat protein [Methanothermobacter thermautotrophicus]|uniref:tetratricopeptide repeat protein n=1 Tax=Methanothermobacter thermautotrophicus TaxID=145262 RepID=UPI0022B935ED|nr:tetratricopeptide repeat protein [Methanothermobacter thermautotrophicus]WBF06081.1 tetratricopeptide repeat protein [Methanothermobacter thermautotrophicus]HOQ17889.1 tetratricopeptide repeat protein [Methanothermobacter thermautotrophicus]
MPILSFSSRDIDLVTGKRTMTIRRKWKRPLRVGDRLHCYWNLVSKDREKVFEAVVTDVETVSFRELRENDELAREDGFRDAKQLEEEFQRMYQGELTDDTEFQVIRFRKLPVDEWEGKRIDEKAMITRRADILFDSGKFSKSELCYTAALRIDPNDVYILNRLGDNLTRLGRFDEALENYRRAIMIEPENPYIWNNMAITLLNAGRVDEALEASERALKIKHDPDLLYWRGVMLEVAGKPLEALESYERSLEIDPRNAEVWTARGNLLSDLGRMEEAIESYNSALELALEDEQDPNVWNRKGNALLELERFNEALECYRRAIEMEPENDVYWTNMGVALLELERFDEALEAFNRALMINPKNEDAGILREECLENL